MKRIIILIGITMLCTVFGQAQANIKSIDFNNYSYKLTNRTVKIVKGLEQAACTEKSADGIPSGDIWSVANIVHGDLDADGKPEAIVALVANVCGGNMITNEQIVVFSLKKGKAVQLPSFDYFDEGCKAGEPGCNFARNPVAGIRYDASNKSLVVETTYSTDEDAICCPSLSRETWYKWNGKAFVESKKGKIMKTEEKK
jgi:hypothetical protein